MKRDDDLLEQARARRDGLAEIIGVFERMIADGGEVVNVELWEQIRRAHDRAAACVVLLEALAMLDVAIVDPSAKKARLVEGFKQVLAREDEATDATAEPE